MTHRAYVFRLNANVTTSRALVKAWGGGRWVRNWALGSYVQAQRLHHQALLTGALPHEAPPLPRWNLAEVSRDLTQLKQRPKTAWLKAVPSSVLTQALKDLDTAFTNFFSGRARFPTFQKKFHAQSMRLQLDPRYVAQNFIPGQLLRVPVLGELKLRWSRIPTGAPKMITIRRDAVGTMFVSFMCDEMIMPLSKTGQTVGIDLGIKTAIMTSDGIGSGPIQILKHAVRKLKHAQRVLSRKTKGSARWEQQRVVVAQLHRRVVRIRRDLQHQLTTALIRAYDGVCIEDLNVKGMLRNHKLARALSDVGFAELRRQLEYKAAWYGRWIQPISRWEPSSQMCSGCRTKHVLKLSNRHMNCSVCGLKLDRDHNAAINIKRAGLALRGAV